MPGGGQGTALGARRNGCSVPNCLPLMEWKGQCSLSVMGRKPAMRSKSARTQMALIARTREKGKIAHSEWPKIVSRYSNGETIASIGRGYGCTAPAIRYIIKRSGMLKGEVSRERRPAAFKSASRSRTSRTGSTVDKMARTLLQAADIPLSAPSRGRAAGKDVLGAELRKRVSGDLASFLVALDHVVGGGSVESLTELQEATDRLMRSVARTRMEIERLLGRSGSAAAN